MTNKQVFSSGFELFDEIFNELNSLNGTLSNGFSQSLENDFKSICSSVFPPVNLILKKNKDLIFEFAVAGYIEEDIDLTFEGDKMYLELKKVTQKLEDGDIYLLKTMKHSSQKNGYIVPVSKYDVSNATASVKNGLLKVMIPAREETKPRKVKINL